jgi:hypothetical protein
MLPARLAALRSGCPHKPDSPDFVAKEKHSGRLIGIAKYLMTKMLRSTTTDLTMRYSCGDTYGQTHTLAGGIW